HVAEIEQALAAVAGQRLAVLAEAGDVVHAGRQALVLRFRDVAAARVLDGAEVARERHLLLVGELLAAEHEHGVLVHAGLDARHVLWRERLADVYSGHLADEHGMNLADRDGHALPPVRAAASRWAAMIGMKPPQLTSNSARNHASANAVRLCGLAL